ncbi:MAG: YggT family protein [Pseudobdellovibrionaceae bacterium]
MYFIASILHWLISAYIFVIIAEVVLSWLIAFEVINTRNPQAQNLIRLIKRLTDPVMNPVRKVVPAIGGIDITPIIVIFALSLIDTHIVGRLAYVGYSY